MRQEWDFWWAKAKCHGFGRTELRPIKSNIEGISYYIGKYISKHIDSRLPEDKGVRLVRYSKTAKYATTRFAWVTERSYLWRKKIERVAQDCRFKEMEEFSENFGQHWCFHLAPMIISEPLCSQSGGFTYPTRKHALADNLPEELLSESGSKWFKLECNVRKAPDHFDPIWIPKRWEDPYFSMKQKEANRTINKHENVHEKSKKFQDECERTGLAGRNRWTRVAEALNWLRDYKIPNDSPELAKNSVSGPMIP